MKLFKTDIVVIITLLAFLSSYPYIVECFLPIPSVNITGPLFLLISIIIYLSTKKRKIVYHDSMIICLVLQMLLWFFYSFIHSDTTYLTRIFFVFFTLTLLCTLAVRNQLVNFIRIHSWIVATQALLGLVSFILVFFDILKPVTNYILQDGRIGGSQQIVENSSRDGNTRPPYLTPEKSICRSRAIKQSPVA